LNCDHGGRRRKPEEADDTFMMSFSSLMILLLTFMILMVTLSTFKEPRFRKAIGSLKGALSVLPHTGGPNPMLEGTAGFLPEEMLARAGEGTEEEKDAYTEAVEKMKEHSKSPDMTGLVVDETEEGLAINISDRLLFERGEAELKPSVGLVLDLVVEAVLARPASVAVVGHTCNLAISTSRFASNWELSLIRATNVLHHLEEKGVPSEWIYAYGLADQRPVAPNDSEAHRARNRRVEIFVTHMDKSGQDG
jgi:chemotaxis protein MotB